MCKQINKQNNKKKKFSHHQTKDLTITSIDEVIMIDNVEIYPQTISSQFINHQNYILKIVKINSAIIQVNSKTKRLKLSVN